ncbi:hypothetical protein Q7C36_019612 [Tachysurus vachellii]|uniref:Uncharacterized protein n=1 Tax=Tachysurus vachellii TaxID=175792 RepID=A0AA88LS32_TACVA|nr:hypothetical protein Q7C36_019612 [Tachysurus vachellii]
MKRSMEFTTLRMNTRYRGYKNTRVSQHSIVAEGKLSLVFSPGFKRPSARYKQERQREEGA